MQTLHPDEVLRHILDAEAGAAGSSGRLSDFLVRRYGQARRETERNTVLFSG